MRTLFAVTRVRGKAWDPAKPMRSQDQWSEHAVFMEGLAEAGFIVLGGPIGDGGEVLHIVNAADEGEIHSRFAPDPWSESGLLDIRGIQRWTVLLEGGTPAKAPESVRQVVPFLAVSDMERSFPYYVDGLGFTMKYKWVVDGKLRWCWLELGGAALMLQEFLKEGPDSREFSGKLGEGVSLCFVCEDAVAFYRTVTSRGVEASEPEVGNGMWVTCLKDPDGYRLDFESYTDVPEDTKLSEIKG